MRDPDSFPTCSTCGDVVLYCKCLEKLNDKMMEQYKNGEKCPKCMEEKNIVKIEYGYPGNDMIEKNDRGEIKLGGCTVHDKNPDYHCRDCKYEWQSEQPHAGEYADPDS